MGKTLALTRQKFERLTAICPTRKRKNGHVVWECLCNCGKKCFVLGSSLKNGETKSCGCLWREQNKKCLTVHGMSKTPEHKAWANMIQRCENPNHDAYHNYGGRGISVSEEFHDFQAWHEHIGPKPAPRYTQDRIDNDGNYEKGNIRWVTRKEQANNRRKKSF